MSRAIRASSGFGSDSSIFSHLKEEAQKRRTSFPGAEIMPSTRKRNIEDPTEDCLKAREIYTRVCRNLFQPLQETDSVSLYLQLLARTVRQLLEIFHTNEKRVCVFHCYHKENRLWIFMRSWEAFNCKKRTGCDTCSTMSD